MAKTNVDTDANMTVTNDNMDCNINVQENGNDMDDQFPSGPISAASSLQRYISASAFPGQSSFSVVFTGTPPAGPSIQDTYTVDIGSTPYVTEIQNSTQLPLGSSGAVLAPGDPASLGIDYNFFFFCGPAVLTPLIEGFLQTNLAAIAAYASANPIQKTLTDGIELEINQIPGQVSCTYAAVTVTHTNPSTYTPDQFHVNVVLKANGTVGGNITLANVASGGFGVEVSNLAVLLSIDIDLSGPQLVVKVANLQVSLDAYNLTGVITLILNQFPQYKVLLALSTPYRIAGAINTTFNGQIVDAINTAIADHLPKSSEATAAVATVLKLVGRREASADVKKSLKENAKDDARKAPEEDKLAKDGGKARKKAVGDENLAWMSNLQGQSIGNLCIPGTHDSATYALVNELSLIQYPDIKFLWDFNFTDSPAPSTKNPFTAPFYTGPVLGKYFLDSINRVSQAQGNNILQQLQDGIRYLDLRIYYDPADQRCYAQHGLKGPALDDIVAQVVQFLPQASTELIVFAISHTNFANFIQSDGTNPAVISASASLSKIPTQNLYMPPGANGAPNFDLNTLASTTVGTIINGTGSKVMVLNVIDTSGKSGPQATFPFLAINTSGYTIAAPGDNPWPASLTLVSNAQALRTNNIITNVLLGLTKTTDKSVALESFAEWKNTYLGQYQYSPMLDFATGCWGAINVFNMDWYEAYDPDYLDGPNAVDYVISLNYPNQ